jgi:hypothetical protein
MIIANQTGGEVGKISVWRLGLLSLYRVQQLPRAIHVAARSFRHPNYCGQIRSRFVFSPLIVMHDSALK